MLIEENPPFRVSSILLTKSGLVDELKGCFTNKIFGPGRLPPSDQVRKIYGMVSPHAGTGTVGAWLPMAITAYHPLNLTTLYLWAPIIMVWAPPLPLQ